VKGEAEQSCGDQGVRGQEIAPADVSKVEQQFDAENYSGHDCEHDFPPEVVPVTAGDVPGCAAVPSNPIMGVNMDLRDSEMS
jgi:hypothetical protein